MSRQREVVDAFLTAARGGDFDGLIAVLDPNVVLRSDGGVCGGTVTRGAATVAGQALTFARLAEAALPALVNGTLLDPSTRIAAGNSPPRTRVASMRMASPQPMPNTAGS